MALVINYCNIQDIQVQPSNVWYAGNSINSGNNSGWAFISSNPIVVVYNTYLQDSQVSGPTIWLALISDGNVNGGNNSGWLFNPPNAGGAMAIFYP